MMIGPMDAFEEGGLRMSEHSEETQRRFSRSLGKIQHKVFIHILKNVVRGEKILQNASETGNARRLCVL